MQGGDCYPVVPLTKTQSPVTTAREYPISSSKAEPELIFWREVIAIENRESDRIRCASIKKVAIIG
jgi:hypothetical protein